MSSSIIIKNLFTISDYEDLQIQKLEPKLGIYRKNRLVIVSQNSKTKWQVFIQIVKRIVNFLKQQFGLLSYNSKRIEELKFEAKQFLLTKKFNIKNLEAESNHLNNIKLEVETKTTQKNTLEKELIGLQSNYHELLTEISSKQELEAEVRKVRNELDKLAEIVGSDITSLNAILEEKSKELVRLTKSQKLLETKEAEQQLQLKAQKKTIETQGEIISKNEGILTQINQSRTISQGLETGNLFLERKKKLLEEEIKTLENKKTEWAEPLKV